MRPRGRCIPFGSSGSSVYARGIRSGSSGCALGGVVLLRVCLICRVRPGSSCVCSGSSGYALEVVGFVRVRLVCLCAPWGLLGSIWFVSVRPRSRWFVWVLPVRPCTHWRSLGSFEFVWFVCVHRGDCWVRSGLSGSSVCALGVVHLFGFFRFVRVRPEGRWVRSGFYG